MYLYQILNIETGKVYIGQTMNKPERRWADHILSLNKFIHPNAKLQSAWNKYGQLKFEFSTVAKLKTQDELDSLEIEYIEKYMKENNSYNLKGGGKSGYLISDETRDKMRLAKTPEIKERLSMRMRNNNPMNDPESRRLALLGALCGHETQRLPENRQKMSQILTKIKPSAKLTQTQVDEIRGKYKMGSNYKTLATEYNVGKSTIGRIIRMECWKEIKNDY